MSTRLLPSSGTSGASDSNAMNRPSPLTLTDTSLDASVKGRPCAT
jgi:hypothetical protein